MDSRVCETHVHKIVRVLYENGEVVAARDRLSLALGLSRSVVNDIDRTTSIKLSDTQHYLTIMLSKWISSNSVATFGRLIEVLREEDFNSTAEKLNSIVNSDPLWFRTEHLKMLELEPECTDSGFWFDVPDDVLNFTGRADEMKQLHDMIIAQNRLPENSNDSTINTTLISGLGGIGKTALAIRYAWKYFNVLYTNVVWIKSETMTTFADSFNRLARKLRISTTTLEITEIATEIYEYFGKTKTLVIFDNVESFQSIESYLPVRSPKTLKPYVMITSRNRVGNLRTNFLELNVFSMEDSVHFFKIYLNIEAEAELDSAGLISSVLQYLPLAITQAGAYIKMQRSENKMTTIDLMKSYMNLFNTNWTQFIHWSYTSDKYEKTIYNTWMVGMEKLKRLNSYTGSIIEVISYFNSDNIPVELLYNLERPKGIWKMFSGQSSRSNAKIIAGVDEAIRLLSDFSMITKHRDANFISVHRLLQKVVRNEVERKAGCSVLKNAISLVQIPLKLNNHDDYGEVCLIHSLSVSTYLPPHGQYEAFLDLVKAKQTSSIDMQVKRLIHSMSEGTFGKTLEVNYQEIKRLYVLQTNKHFLNPSDELFTLRFVKVICMEIKSLWESGDINYTKVLRFCNRILKGFQLSPINWGNDFNEFETSADVLRSIALKTGDNVMKNNLHETALQIYSILFEYSKIRRNFMDISKCCQNVTDCLAATEKYSEIKILFEKFTSVIVEWSDSRITSDKEFLAFCGLILQTPKMWKCAIRGNCELEFMQVALVENKKLYTHFKSKKHYRYAFRVGSDIIFFLARLGYLEDIIQTISDMQLVLTAWLQSADNADDKRTKTTRLNLSNVPNCIIKSSGHANCASIRNEMLDGAFKIYSLLYTFLQGKSHYLNHYLHCVKDMVDSFISVNRMDDLLQTVRNFKFWFQNLSESVPWFCLIKTSEIIKMIWTKSNDFACAATRDIFLEECILISRLIFNIGKQKSKISKFLCIATDLTSLANIASTDGLSKLILDYVASIDYMKIPVGTNCSIVHFADELVKIGYMKEAYLTYDRVYNFGTKINPHVIVPSFLKNGIGPLIKCIVELNKILELLQLIDNCKIFLEESLKFENHSLLNSSSQAADMAISILEISKHSKCEDVKDELILSALYIFKKNSRCGLTDIYSKNILGIINSLAVLNKSDEVIVTINAIEPVIVRRFQSDALLCKAECVYTNANRQNLAEIRVEMLELALISYKAALDNILSRTTHWNLEFYHLKISTAACGLIDCLKELDRTHEISESMLAVRTIFQKYCDVQETLPENHLTFAQVADVLFKSGIQSLCPSVKYMLIREALWFYQIQYDFVKKDFLGHILPSVNKLLQCFLELNQWNYVTALCEDIEQVTEARKHCGETEAIYNTTVLTDFYRQVMWEVNYTDYYLNFQ